MTIGAQFLNPYGGDVSDTLTCLGTLFCDTFTDDDAVLLENHTPDVGSNWTALGLATASILNNELTIDVDDSIYFNDLGTGQQRLTCVLLNIVGTFQLIARYTDANNYLAFEVDDSLNLRIIKVDTGVPTTLETVVLTDVLGTLTFILFDDLLQVSIGNVIHARVTETFNQAVTGFGIMGDDGTIIDTFKGYDSSTFQDPFCIFVTPSLATEDWFVGGAADEFIVPSRECDVFPIFRTERNLTTNTTVNVAWETNALFVDASVGDVTITLPITPDIGWSIFVLNVSDSATQYINGAVFFDFAGDEVYSIASPNIPALPYLGHDCEIIYKGTNEWEVRGNVYPQESIPRNLVLYYSCDSFSGAGNTLLDSSGNDEHGIAVNSPIVTPGRLDNSLRGLSASGSYVVSPIISSLDGDISVSCFGNKVSNIADGNLFFIRQNADDQLFWGVQHWNSDNNIYIYNYDGVGLAFSAPLGLIAINTWYHIAVKLVAGTFTIWINGVSQTYTPATLVTPTNPHMLVCSFTTASFGDSLVDELLITTDAITQDYADYSLIGRTLKGGLLL